MKFLHLCYITASWKLPGRYYYNTHFSHGKQMQKSEATGSKFHSELALGLVLGSVIPFNVTPENLLATRYYEC